MVVLSIWMSCVQSKCKVIIFNRLPQDFAHLFYIGQRGNTCFLLSSITVSAIGRPLWKVDVAPTYLVTFQSILFRIFSFGEQAGYY